MVKKETEKRERELWSNIPNKESEDNEESLHRREREAGAREEGYAEGEEVFALLELGENSYHLPLLLSIWCISFLEISYGKENTETIVQWKLRLLVNIFRLWIGYLILETWSSNSWRYAFPASLSCFYCATSWVAMRFYTKLCQSASLVSKLALSFSLLVS